MTTIYPEPAIAANTSALRAEEFANLSRKPSINLDSSINIGEIGETIPIVFCKKVGDIGGTWLVPPTVRYGLQNQNNDAKFSLAFILSEGQITTPIANYSTDIFLYDYPWGGFPGLAQFITNRYQQVTYGSLPTGNPLSYTINLTQYYDFESNSYETAPISAGGNAYYLNIPSPPSTETGTGTLSIQSSSPYCTYLVWFASNLGTDFKVNYTTTSPVATVRSYDNIYNVSWEYTFEDDTGVLDTGRSSIGNAEGRFPSTDLSPITLTLSLPEYSPRVKDDNIPSGTTYTDFSVTDQHIFSITEHIQAPFIIPEVFTFNISTLKQDTSGNFSGLTLLGLYGVHDVLSTTSQDNAGVAEDIINTFADLHNQQVTVFCSNGVNVTNLIGGGTGPSNNYADLVNYLGLQFAESISMNTASLTQAANFTNANGLFFNGTISDAVNYKEWIAATAQFFLLTPLNLESRIGLRPAVPITAGYAINTGVLTPVYTFDEDSIVTGSYSISYIPLAERRPFEAVILWRDQNDPGTGVEIPYTTMLQVRFSSYAGELPQERYDMTDFCVTEAHATKAAKYFLSKRRRTTHTVSFSTDIFTTVGLLPGDLIAIQLDRVTSDGTSRTETEYYQIETLVRRMDGTASITAEHFPLSGGASVIAADIVSGSFTVT